MSHTIITDTATLTSYCERWAQEPYVTIDTEFMRETTYYPKLCLVQVAGANDAAAIDPLAAGIDLAPLFTLLANQQVLKVFHAARQDIEIFYYLAGAVPQPIFDTQIAAMVCGYGESVSYESLVNQIIGQPLDKSSRFTDWSHRPLTDKQTVYAISDVTHLRGIYEKLNIEVEREGRKEWIAEEMHVLTSPATYDTNPDDAWRKIRLRMKTPKFVGMLQALARWRELEARRADQPRGRILKDEILTEIAATAPTTLDAMSRVRGIGQGFVKNKGQVLLDIIAETAKLPNASFPKLPAYTPMPEGSDVVVDMLKLLLKKKSEEHRVASKLIATRDNLEEIILSSDPNLPVWHGWRYDVFGKSAKALLEGKIGYVFNPQTRQIEMRDIA